MADWRKRSWAYVVWTVMAVAAFVYASLAIPAAEPGDYVDLQGFAYFVVFAAWLIGLPLIALVAWISDEIRDMRAIKRHVREPRRTNPPLLPPI